MVDRARRLRDQIQEQQRAHKAHEARRYPKRLRVEILGYLQDRLDGGVPVSASARSLGLSAPTLYGWLRAARRRGEFRNVRVVSNRGQRLAFSPSTSVTLVSPQGYRVEGLDVASVSVLLRELA